MGKRRVNLTLPDDLLDQVRTRVSARGLSQYVAEAVAARLAAEQRATLCQRLKEQYLARAAQDRKLAEEFFAAEQEAIGQIKRNNTEVSVGLVPL